MSLSPKKNNITIAITATANAVAVAEHVMYMMLSLSKGVVSHDNAVRKGLFKKGIADIQTLELNGKEVSYNNLLDVDSAVNLITEFNTTTFAILKHNNTCGIASRKNLVEAWKDALAGDPTSAFGGVLITNKEVCLETAMEIDKIFYEVLIAPKFTTEALKILKKNSINILIHYYI